MWKFVATQLIPCIFSWEMKLFLQDLLVVIVIILMNNSNNVSTSYFLIEYISTWKGRTAKKYSSLPENQPVSQSIYSRRIMLWIYFVHVKLSKQDIWLDDCYFMLYIFGFNIRTYPYSTKHSKEREKHFISFHFPSSAWSRDEKKGK